MTNKQIISKSKFIVCNHTEMIANQVSKVFIEVLNKKPHSVFVLATGSTPIPVYQKLIDSYKLKQSSWKNVTTFNLDEYLDLKPQYQEQSYRSFMKANLFDHIDINQTHTYFPSKETIGVTYSKMIKNCGKADITLLGIGINGHIAFNEPGTQLDSETRINELDESTRQANSRFFDNDINNVPKQAITMGLKTIIDNSKKIILIATGKNKANAIKKLKNAQSFDPSCPATALLFHPNVQIYLDEDAASLI